MKKIVLVFIIFVLLPFSAFAQSAVENSWTEDEKSQIENGFSDFAKHVKSNDITAIIDNFPPLILSYAADIDKTDVASFKKTLAKSLASMNDGMKTIDGKFEPQNIIYRRTSGGEKYAIIPYITDIVYEDNRKQTINRKALVVKIDGKYYYLEVSKEINVIVIKKVYPQFENIDVSIN